MLFATPGEGTEHSDAKEPRRKGRGRAGVGRGPAAPALVAHGDLDAVIPPANAKALAARWPGARVEVLAGCGHALMAQEPRRIADLIAALADD